MDGPLLHQLNFRIALFLSALAFIFFLEKRIPAVKEQSLLGRGLIQDSVWFVMAVTSRSLASVLVVNEVLVSLSFQPWERLAQVPHLFRFIIGVLAADCLARFHHRLQHRLPFLWVFHQVHHTQVQLNAMTAARIHIVDYLLLQLCLMGPLVLLGVQTSYIAAFSVWVNWQSRFCHSNIRAHLGWLRHIFVTPQSHRIHHSVEDRHLNRNFGITFSFWDRIFATHYGGHTEYPLVGVVHPTIPVEDQHSLWSMIRTPFLQLVYPFVIIGRRLTDRKFAAR